MRQPTGVTPSLRGAFTAYVLIIIHLGSRKVYCSIPTISPNGEWVVQQNRNASMWAEDEGIDIEVLDKSFRPKSRGQVRSKQQLGGIITSYYRDAA